MDLDESAELDAFFKYVSAMVEAVAERHAIEAAKTLKVPKARVKRYLRAACEDALFRLFAAIDGEGGSDDFPEVEITLEEGKDSLNASPLHEIFDHYMKP
jgi:hypothetical protein